MAGEQRADLRSTGTTYATPVCEEFTVTPERLAVAKTAYTRLLGLLGILSVVAILPWLILRPVNGLMSLHWLSIGLGLLTLLTGATTWWQRHTARWWIGAQNAVLKITDDEIVLRGSIRIPTNVIVGVWGFRAQRLQGSFARNPIKRLLSQNGASTSAITILVSSVAPIVDPHERLRRFSRAEVAGRIEIPFGAYLDDEGALEGALDACARALGDQRPTMILESSYDYGAAWSGVPSRISQLSQGV